MLPLHICPGLLEPWKARISYTLPTFRSLFSGAKRWFGTNKGSPSGGTSVVYSREAPELQVRRKYLCSFFEYPQTCMFIGAEVGRPLLFDEDVQAGVQLCLHQQEGLPDGWGEETWLSRGFQCFPEQAWPYYAAAAELAALSMFMLSSTDPGKGCLPRPCLQQSNVYKYWTIIMGSKSMTFLLGIVTLSNIQKSPLGLGSCLLCDAGHDFSRDCNWTQVSFCTHLFSSHNMLLNWVNLQGCSKTMMSFLGKVRSRSKPWSAWK